MGSDPRRGAAAEGVEAVANHLLAENEKTTYIAYVSEQNLLPDATGEPCRHPQIDEVFGDLQGDCYEIIAHVLH